MAPLSLHNVSLAGRLDNISLCLAPGTLTGLVGPNGSGKSSLLQAAAGILPCSGDIHWQGRELAKIPIMERGRLTTWVPQEAHFEFGFTVRSVVAQGRYAHGDDDAGVNAAIERLELTTLASRPVNQLSGGERQRVLLARALVTDAPLQLWDEPLAPLDPKHALKVMVLARELARRDGAAVMFSLHDLALAHELDWLVVLDSGRLRAAGKPQDVLSTELLQEVFRVRIAEKPGLMLELP